jgi:hypothetical protein
MALAGAGRQNFGDWLDGPGRLTRRLLDLYYQAGEDWKPVNNP